VSGQNTKGNWTFTYHYTTDGTAAVDANTCWNADASGSTTVNVGFSGFVSSESYLLQSSKTKYSFTLLENNVTRVRGVSAQLESSPDGLIWTPVVGALADLNNTDTDGDSSNDALAVSATAADYSYFGNAGVFGKSGVFGSLHAPSYLAATSVNAILALDNFPNNNNDLASGNVHQATYGGTWSGVAGDPAGSTLYYRTVISGTIKGNASSGSQQFSVASVPVIIGGC
jgi:hypothetical protein